VRERESERASERHRDGWVGGRERERGKIHIYAYDIYAHSQFRGIAYIFRKRIFALKDQGSESGSSEAYANAAYLRGISAACSLDVSSKRH
jgi:hypothetical protein